MALASDIAGIEFKSGRENSITEDTTRVVVFNTPFESGPVDIVVSFGGPSNEHSTVNAFNISTTGTGPKHPLDRFQETESLRVSYSGYYLSLPS